MASLEAASIDAFGTLEDDLCRFRAPRSLVHAARCAKRDERRHARAMRSLAWRYGERAFASPRVEQVEPRALEAIAIENAVEGCVRETFGALVASWQSRKAGDPLVRAAMRRIARDEATHAALGWSVHDWVLTRLEPAARGRLHDAMRSALFDLERGMGEEPTADVVRDAGLPTSEQAARLLEALTRELA
jgi:hypothetical protein